MFWDPWFISLVYDVALKLLIGVETISSEFAKNAINFVNSYAALVICLPC